MWKERHYVSMGVVIGILLVLLGVFWWGVHTGTGAALAQTGPLVQIVPQALGQQDVVLSITGTNISNLGGFEFDLNANPSVAQVAGARLGGFLEQSGRIVGQLGPILDTGGGTIAFGGYSYDPSGNNAPGASGDGPLAYVTMTVRADGVTTLTLNNLIVADVNATSQGVQVMNAALQVRTLHPGWNLVAPCVDTRGWRVMRVLASLVGDFDLVLGESGTYVVGLPDTFQTLHEIAPPWGYYIRVSSGQPVTLTQVAGDVDVSVPITLSTGWRWVGYCGGTPLPVSQALQSISGSYDLVIGERGTYVVGLPDTFQTLREMRQGEGYLIRMTGDGVLIYPNGKGNPRRFVKRDEVRDIDSAGQCRAQNTPYMTLVYGLVWIDGAPAQPGTLVEAVTPRGEVAGCFTVRASGTFGVMQVYGKDEEGGIPGFHSGEHIIWRVNGQEVISPQITWRDDKTVHKVVLRVGKTAESRDRPQLFVPWLLK